MPPSLHRRLRRARRVLLWERLWRASVGPTAGGAAALLGLALLSRLPDLAEPLHWSLLAGLGLLPLAGGIQTARSLRKPTDTDALARLDHDLPHAPARTLLDRPATDDPLARALWARHQARAEAALAAAPPVTPSPGLAARDPRALRALVPLGALVALTVLQADGAALERALWPPADRPVPPPPTVQAWLEPPPHADGAAVQPLPQNGEGRIPQGGRLRLSVQGGPAEAFLGGRLLTLSPGEDLVLPLTTPFQALLNVHADGQEVWRATLEVLPDRAPRLEIVQAPDRGDGRLRLRIRAADDLGLQGARLRLEDALGNIEAFPLEGARGRAVEIPVVLDVARDARAGSPVRLVADAEDGAGQGGEAVLETILPERQWHQPLARRLADARRLLLRRGPAAAPGIEAAAVDLRAADAPLAAILAADAAARRARVPGGIWEAEGLLWEAAVEIEDGPIVRALANAARAAQGADAAQDAAAIDALANRLMEFLTALAQAAPAQGVSSPVGDGQTQTVSVQDLAAAVAEARRLAAEGRVEEARNLLARLAETLQRLSEASAQGQAPDSARQAAAQAMAEEARRLLAEQIAAADRLAQAAPPPFQVPNALSAEGLAIETRVLSERLRDAARQARQELEQRRLRRDEPLAEEAEAVADALEQAADAVGSPTPADGRDRLVEAAHALARLHQALADAAQRKRLFPEDGLFRDLSPQQRAQLRAQEAQQAQRLEQQRAQIAAQLEQALARRAEAQAAEAAAAAARAAAGPLASQAEAQRRIAEDAANLEAGAEALGLPVPGAAGPARQAADALASENANGAARAQAQAADALRRLLEQLEQAGGQGAGGGTAPGARRPWEGGRPDLTGQGGSARQWQDRIQQRLQDGDAAEDARRYWRRLLRLPDGS